MCCNCGELDSVCVIGRCVRGVRVCEGTSTAVVIAMVGEGCGVVWMRDVCVRVARLWVSVVGWRCGAGACVDEVLDGDWG